MKHVSVNCCEYGVDIIVTNLDDQTVHAIRWTWDDLERHVVESGEDVTQEFRKGADGYLPRDPGKPDDG